MAIAQFDLATASGADLKKALLPLFNPPREPVLVDIPELGYLMIDGHGAPEESATQPTTEFQQSFGAIFPVVYTIKFRLKREGCFMPILPLEALWYTNENFGFDMNVPPEQWDWLKADLESAKARGQNTIAYSHIPIEVLMGGTSPG